MAVIIAARQNHSYEDVDYMKGAKVGSTCKIFDVRAAFVYSRSDSSH